MARKWPLVSVCILSFNRLEYLKRTLRSFRETCTYPNLEYLIVDNGSSKEIIDYINSLEYIDRKIFNEKNMGMGYALNQIRKAAKGDFFFNLENDWFFFYHSDWMERGVLLFEKDKRGESVHKKPAHLPLGIVKYKIGAGLGKYTNNPSLVIRKAYTDVGEYAQFTREYNYVSEDVHKVESNYIKRFREKYAGTLSETPCAIHIGGDTTNPNYGNRGRKKYSELDNLLRGKWKDGKWHITYHYWKLGNRVRIRRAIRRYRIFEQTREEEY